MKKTNWWLAFWMAFWLAMASGAAPSFAQDQPAQDQPAPAAVHGALTLGYRFTNVSGRREKYDELFALRQGWRVHDFSLYSGETQPTALYDSFFLTGSGIGGEPFSGGQFNIKKNHVYDLRVNYQQSYFYWNRNDDQQHPTGLHGLLTNHDWSTVRKIGSVNLATYVTNRLRLNVEYQHSGRHGSTDTTRALDYFGAPSTWGSFMRANPYVVEAQLDEDADRVTAGVSYTLRDFSFYYRTGFQRFEQNIDTRNLAPGQRSINTDEATTSRELLNQALWIDHRTLRTPVSEFSYNGKITDRLHSRGGYIFYRHRGPRAVIGSFSGTARTTGTNVAPYAVTFRDDSEAAEQTHVIDQGFSLEVRPKLNVHADYRYFRYSINTDVAFTSINGATSTTGRAETEWRQGFQMLDLAIEYRPLDRLQIRPGIRLMKRDVIARHDGVTETQATRRSKIASPILTVYYSPSRKVMLRGDVQTATNGSPYTRISPRREFNLRWIGRYEPTERLTIENNLRIRTADFKTSDYRNAIRSNATNVTLRLHERLALMGGFTYDSFLATASVTFLRGTAPLNATWRDQTVNRLWQAGVDANPIPRLSLNLSGNYLRTTGVGEISGEPPTSGPIRWPFVTGTAAYEFPHVGRLSIDVQRTYYIEEILRGDNFGAGMLNLRWTKEF